MRTHAYIDASNLFYGGKKSLGWSIDYEKLFQYLKDKYKVSEVLYFGGVEIHHFPFDYLTNETVNVRDLEKYLTEYIKEKGKISRKEYIQLTNVSYRQANRDLNDLLSKRLIVRFGKGRNVRYIRHD